MFYRRNLIAMTVVILGLLMLVTFAQAEEKVIPIRDFKDIAGTWEGILTSTDGWSSPVTTIINEDGTGDVIYPADSVIFAYTDKGHMPNKRELFEGKIRSKNMTTGATGIMTLHEGGGKRVLEYISDDGKISVKYEPATKSKSGIDTKKVDSTQ